MPEPLMRESRDRLMREGQEFSKQINKKIEQMG